MNKKGERRNINMARCWSAMLKYSSPESPLYKKWKKVSVGIVGILFGSLTYDLVYVNGFDLQQDYINFVMLYWQ